MVSNTEHVQENWAVDPITKGEFPLFYYKNQTHYLVDDKKEAERIMAYLARHNPTVKVFYAEVTKSAQVPPFLGDISFTEINDKGMLPL